MSNTKDTNLEKLARYKRNSGCVYNSSTGKWESPPATTFAKDGSFAKVGSYNGNSWGIYDMHGNVCEWVIDCYAADITGLNGAICTTESVGSKGIKRVMRGGDMGSDASSCRSACRSSEGSSNWYGGVAGVRLKCLNGLPTDADATIVEMGYGLSTATTLTAQAPQSSAAVGSTESIKTSGAFVAACEKVIEFLRNGFKLLLW